MPEGQSSFLIDNFIIVTVDSAVDSITFIRVKNFYIWKAYVISFQVRGNICESLCLLNSTVYTFGNWSSENGHFRKITFTLVVFTHNMSIFRATRAVHKSDSFARLKMVGPRLEPVWEFLVLCLPDSSAFWYLPSSNNLSLTFCTWLCTFFSSACKYRRTKSSKVTQKNVDLRPNLGK